MALTSSKLWALGCFVALCAVSCERRPKRTLRTEPWPAPALSSVTGPVAVNAPLRYVVDSGEAQIDLRAKKGKLEATLPRITGTIDLDPLHLERSTAKLRVDLLSLELSSEQPKDGALFDRALQWLELTPERPQSERERDRYAELEILAFEGVPRGDEPDPPRRGQVTAHGNLTLHHFRVPIELELSIDRDPEEGRLVIRTQRPFVVSLVAHDILPRDSGGKLIANGISALGSEVPREARVSARLSARLSPIVRPPSSNH